VYCLEDVTASISEISVYYLEGVTACMSEISVYYFENVTAYMPEIIGVLSLGYPSRYLRNIGVLL
jgi:hypothetical protein